MDELRRIGIRLTEEEQGMLHGEQGPAVQRAMEIVVALGRIYGASHLVPVASVQVAGVSFKNLGEAGLSFLEEWADQGAQVRVPTTLNPAGMDTTRWRVLGFSEEFARQQERVIEAYARMGTRTTCTCTPYLVGNQPSFGQHVAWAESSAVCFANSVLGARTNREGGPSALAAAICGCTAAYGLHLDQGRRARFLVEVRCQLRTLSDWGVLGYIVGHQVRNAVPCFVLGDQQPALPEPDALATDAGVDRLKALGAALAASGAVALYHVHGVTPEARQGDVVVQDPEHVVVDDLEGGYEALNSGARHVDLVSIGCPHASPRELREIARAVLGQHLRAALWVTTAREMREQMAAEVFAIEAAGGQVVADTCMIVAPIERLGFRVLATNSAKMATYAPSHSGLQVRIGDLEQCVEAAVTGLWPTPKASLGKHPK
jgi:predicted aconitase